MLPNRHWGNTLRNDWRHGPRCAPATTNGPAYTGTPPSPRPIVGHPERYTYGTDEWLIESLLGNAKLEPGWERCLVYQLHFMLERGRMLDGIPATQKDAVRILREKYL